MAGSRKKINKADTLINWEIPVKAVNKTISALVEEVASQACKETREDDLENLGTHELSEGLDKEGKPMIVRRKFSDDVDRSGWKDQISPENIVEYTNTKGETFDVDKIKKEVDRPNSPMGWLLELPLSDVTSQHPDVIKIVKEKDEELNTAYNLIEDLKDKNAKIEKDKERVEQTLIQVTIEKNQPTPDTKKTQVLDKVQDHYRDCLNNNGKVRIRLSIFYKSKGVQDILNSGVSVSKKKIAERMREVNKDFGINKKGRPTASEIQPKAKPILKKEKVDLDKLAEEFLEDDI